MNIHFTDFGCGQAPGGIWVLSHRIKAFYDTLGRFHTVTRSTSDKLLPSKGVDIWFVDCGSWGFADNVDCNQLIRAIETFKGKLIFYDLNDAGLGPVKSRINLKPYPSLFDAAHGIVVHTINFQLSSAKRKKTILIPRFLTAPRKEKLRDTPRKIINGTLISGDSGAALQRKNKIVFRGSNSNPGGRRGAYSLPPLRTEIVKLLESYNYGWMDVKLTDQGKRNRELFDGYFVNKHYLSFGKWINLLEESSICLALPGATTWTYRHVEAMSCGTAIISQKFEKPFDDDWMYRDKVLDLFFYFKSDLSDLIDVCKYCISNPEICAERAKRGYEIYKEYFELTPEHTFKDNVWRDIRSQFLAIGINIPGDEKRRFTD